MPSILPISDLRNYTEVLKKVDNSCRVYLTRNGRGVYAIMPITEVDEYDKLKAEKALAQDLRSAEERAQKEGWINADEFDKEMGIIE